MTLSDSDGRDEDTCHSSQSWRGGERGRGLNERFSEGGERGGGVRERVRLGTEDSHLKSPIEKVYSIRVWRETKTLMATNTHTHTHTHCVCHSSPHRVP